MFDYFGGISFINALGESSQKDFQQFLHGCRITTCHNTFVQA